MIPYNITRDSILQAIEEVDRGLLIVPANQHSTVHCLIYEGKHYPPKYLIRMANVKINGEKLCGFSGGKESNGFLEKRGFEVVKCGGSPHR